MKKKIIVIDDHKIIRDGLNAIFKKNEQFEVIADFDNEADLFSFLKGHSPDLILMDLHLNSANGLELTKRSKLEYPNIKIIMHTMSDSSFNIQLAKELGADGYVLKSGGQEKLEEALTKVAAGEKYYHLN